MRISVSEQGSLSDLLGTARRLVRKKDITPEALERVLGIIQEVKIRVGICLHAGTELSRPRRERYKVAMIPAGEFEAAGAEFQGIQNQLNASLSEYRKKYLRIFYLHVFEGVSIEDLAAMEEKSVNCIRLLLHKAINFMYKQNVSETLRKILLGAKKDDN